MMSEGDKCANIKSAQRGVPASIRPVRTSASGAGSLAVENFGVTAGDSKIARWGKYGRGVA